MVFHISSLLPLILLLIPFCASFLGFPVCMKAQVACLFWETCQGKSVSQWFEQCNSSLGMPFSGALKNGRTLAQ